MNTKEVVHMAHPLYKKSRSGVLTIRTRTSSSPGENSKAKALAPVLSMGASRTRILSSQYSYEEALKAAQGGAMEIAIELYQHAIGLDPARTDAMANLGTIYFNQRQFFLAEKWYRAAIEKDSSYALAHFNLANVCEEQGRLPEAEIHYLRTIQLAPNYSDAHYNLAILYSWHVGCKEGLHPLQGRSVDFARKATKHFKMFLQHARPADPYRSIAHNELARLKEKDLALTPKPAGTQAAPSPSNLLIFK